MMQKLWRYIDVPLSWAEGFTILALLAATLLIAFSQVVARWFGGGWIWADELVRYMVLWLGIFGAASATRNHKHIAIDVLQQMIPTAQRLWLRRVIDLIAATVAFIFVKAIVDYIGFVGDEHSGTLGVTVGTLTWPIAVGFTWIGVSFLADAVLGVSFIAEEDHIHAPTPELHHKEHES